MALDEEQGLATPIPDNSPVPKRRPGVCHRCGWRGLVSRVGWADGRRMKTGRAFGRLCDECYAFLLGTRPSGDDHVSGKERISRLLR